MVIASTCPEVWNLASEPEAWNLRLRLRNGFAERRRRPDDFARADFEAYNLVHLLKLFADLA